MSIATRPGWLTYEQRDSLTEDLVARLHVRYPSERYALLEQVRDGPAFSATRAGDLVAIGLWPSRGCEVEGFELKVSRSDWLRELKAPQKAESLYAYCDRWWLVVPSVKEVLRDGELPPTWGCIEGHGKEKLRAAVPAPKLDPEAVTHWFLAALLKRATAEPIRRARLRDAYLAGKRDGEAAKQGATRYLEELRDEVGRFEQAAGIKIGDDWRRSPEEAGRAVAAFLAGQSIEKKLEDQLNMIGRNLQRALDSINVARGLPVRTEGVTNA